MSKQSDYHRQLDKVLNSHSGAWRLGVKVTNYQDKDEVLSKSLEIELMNKQQNKVTADLKTVSLFNNN